MSTAIITGITGMDGSYLAEYLLSKNYNVIGLKRQQSRLDNIKDIKNNITLLDVDLSDFSSLENTILYYKPNYIYNLASIVKYNEYWSKLYETSLVCSANVINLLEIVKKNSLDINFINISSSEIFGDQSGMLNEESIPMPNNPYAISKFHGQSYTKFYRDVYKLKASNAICFNHESERRDRQFFTRKLSIGVSSIKLGLVEYLEFGDLSVEKDWGYAPDFVEAFVKICESNCHDDYIISTNSLVSLRDIVFHAFEYAGISDVDRYIKFSEKKAHNRPHRKNYGNNSKIYNTLKWQPRNTIYNVIEKMIDYDLKNLRDKYND